MNKYVAKVESFLSSSPAVTMFLYVIGFITSGYITWMALSAQSNAPYVWLSYTIVMECGKAISYLYHVKTRQKKYLYMWLLLTFFSIAASMAFLVIENNVAENRSRTSSLSYQQANDKADRIKEQISIKKSILMQTGKDKEDAKRLIEEYNKSINSLQSTIDAKQSELKVAAQNKWTSTQTRIKEEISQLKSKQNKDIQARDSLSINADTSKISGEIDSLNNQLNSIDFSSLPQEKATSGFFALFQFLGYGTFWIEFIFTLALTTTFEVLICMLYSLSKTNHIADVGNMVKDSIKSKIEAKNNIILDKPPSLVPKIGFNIENSLCVDKQHEIPQQHEKLENGSQIICIEKQHEKQHEKNNPNNMKNNMEIDLKKYLEFANKNLKENGDFPSIKCISYGTGFSPEKCRTIHNRLKDKGIIETSHNPRRTWQVKKY